MYVPYVSMLCVCACVREYVRECMRCVCTFACTPCMLHAACMHACKQPRTHACMRASTYFRYERRLSLFETKEWQSGSNILSLFASPTTRTHICLMFPGL